MREENALQTRTMDGLHVDGELTALVGDDENSDGATARLESLGQATPEVGLIDDREVLLDITGLGHGDDNAILEIKDSVLLEDRAEHGLDNNTWAWVGDERGLFMQLLGEEVDTQVSVLASGSGGGDTDNLARTTLEDQEIAETDVVSGDGDGVGGVGWFGGGRASRSLGAWASAIFIIVTHLAFGETRRIYGLGRDANFFTDRLCWVTRSVDGLFSEADLFSDCVAGGGRVNSGTANTNFFAV